MIWIVLFFIIILVSAVLAFRSMKDYEEFPGSENINSLFFVANSQNFTENSLKKLHKAFLNSKQFFSLERLNKGQERVLVIFGPREIPEILPELKLVEIEDYLADPNSLEQNNMDKKASVNHALTWLIEGKLNKKPLHIGEELKNLDLGKDQQFHIQIVAIPEAAITDLEKFQSTIRVMVVEDDSIERVALAKILTQGLEQATGFNRHQDNFPEQKKFESFKQRSLVPKEVTPFSLSCQEIYALLA